MNASEPNGGFPEPPPGEPVRVLRSTHPGCDGETRIRLPTVLPPRVVRRVVCARCAETYSPQAVVEIEAEPEPLVAGAPAATTTAEPSPPAEQPSTRRGPALRLPPADSPAWRWLGIPLATAVVAAALLLIQGGGDPAPGPPEPGTGPGSADPTPEFIVEPGFSLALPPGWEQTAAEGGAAFSARAVDGSADATLWISRNPNLSFTEFEARSIRRLRSAGGEVEVVERIPAPDQEGRVVRLRAEPPGGLSAPHEVTLRAAGPLRYHLATTVQPGASRQARDGADLIHESFVPDLEAAKDAATGGGP